MIRKIVNLFKNRKNWVRQILVAGLAGGVSWFVGDLLIEDGGVVAAIVCTLSIRISLHKSMREGFGQIVGTAVGAGIALFTVSVFNFGFIAVATTIIFCAVIARALHLGEVASVNVPVTALIVIGPGISQSTAVHRLGSTLIGAAIAILFSYFSHPNTPVGRAQIQIRNVSTKAAALLAEMSEGVAAGYTQKDAGSWLARARLLVEEVPAIRAQSVEARSHARWFPTAEKDEAEDIYIEGIAAEHTLVQVRMIARTLFDSAVEGGIADSTQKQIAVALSAASYAISAHVEIPDDINDDASSPTDDAREAGSVLAGTLIEDGDDVDQDQIVRGLSIVANIGRIADSLDQNSPAITDVITPDEPAKDRVLKLSPMQQTSTIRNKIRKFFRKYF
ncbi:Fusaric acid resistance protein-like [Candidatus Planktophila versatilis]|uniref:Fusaric acid resistance protein-like n=1 Tax=Candidatus Planktophila versatilis TaxID=1884905 RepID=A0AAC9YWI1_9ACTN|nr:FUSC family protein [Candidatus Planktophila versatilis]ASY23023.1 Fusaric acid resistance protein-like [Candidatus Planktophila versatilis]